MSTNINENTVADVNQNITINHFEFTFSYSFFLQICWIVRIATVQSVTEKC